MRGGGSVSCQPPHLVLCGGQPLVQVGEGRGAGHHHQIGLVPLTPPTCSTYRTILYNLYKINPQHLHTERVATKILTINKI